MSYPINYPTPQNANVQIFRGGDAETFLSETSHSSTRDWVKPQGASFVWFTLIGAGGGGGGSMLDSSGPFYYAGGGGASGNVTNFMCPAFLLPDVLQVAIGRGGNGGSFNSADIPGSNGTTGNPTQIIYQQKNGVGYLLLTASGGGDGSGANFAQGSRGTGSTADSGGPMTAAGFYNAIGGQNGVTGNDNISVNNLTFVMGGDGSSEPTNVITGYYGYSATLLSGYSQLSPIPLAIPSASTNTGAKAKSQSFGCGGSGGGVSGVSNGNGGRGGDGLAIIVTW